MKYVLTVEVENLDPVEVAAHNAEVESTGRGFHISEDPLDWNVADLVEVVNNEWADVDVIDAREVVEL